MVAVPLATIAQSAAASASYGALDALDVRRPSGRYTAEKVAARPGATARTNCNPPSGFMPRRRSQASSTTG